MKDVDGRAAELLEEARELWIAALHAMDNEALLILNGAPDDPVRRKLLEIAVEDARQLYEGLFAAYWGK